MTEGIIKQKNIGNTNLWFIETEIEQFIFPNDYFKIKNKYFEYLLVLSTKKIYHLIQSCISSNGDITKILFEVIIPSIKYIANLYDQGKIGKFEKKLIDRIILTSIHMLNITYDEYDNRKTVVMISSDDDSLLQLEAMSALFNSKQWNVFFLGNVSDTIGILFDLDLQKFISKT